MKAEFFNINQEHEPVVHHSTHFALIYSTIYDDDLRAVAYWNGDEERWEVAGYPDEAYTDVRIVED